MKWAFVSTMEGCPWGGSEELWSRAARRLLREGHEVHASVKFWPAPARQIADLQAAGVQVVFRRLDRRKKLTSLAHRLAGGGYVPPVHLDCRRWLERLKPEAVVISQGANFDEWSLFFAEECRRLGVPYAVITQANSLLWMPSDALAERVARMFVEARRAYFVSQGNFQLLEKQIGRTLSNAEVVFNPFNVAFDARPPWRRRPPAPAGVRCANGAGGQGAGSLARSSGATEVAKAAGRCFIRRYGSVGGVAATLRRRLAA